MQFNRVYTSEAEYQRVWGECIQEGLTPQEADDQIARLRAQKTYRDDTYQVNVEEVPAPFGPENGDVIWLSIKRIDREAFHDWRILQEIKNSLVGPENEGFEIYPAESRLVDTANQYHLFVFKDPKVRLPVGYRERLVMDETRRPGQKSKQRPFNKVA